MGQRLRRWSAWVLGWALWRLPPLLRWYVVGVIAAAVAALGAAATLTVWRPADLLLFGLLVGFGVAAVESTRHTTEPAGHRIDVYGIWMLPVALLLPPVYCLTAPMVTFAQLQLRARPTILHRQVFSAAARGLSLALASLAVGLLRVRLPWLWPGTGDRTLLWLVAAAGATLLRLAVSMILVMTAVWLSDRTISVRRELFSRDPLLTDVCEFGTGLLLALAVASSGPVVLIPALPLAVVLQRFFRQAQLLSKARVDSCTGLLAASAWRAEAEVQLARARRIGSPIALGIADLDQFKAINDAHGWSAGDAVLAATAKVLGESLQSSDLLGRLGGEEFVFLLPGAELGEALRVAERLRASIAAQPIPTEPSRPHVHVTVSIGLAVPYPASRDLTDLLTAADAALYRAKQAGRDRICLAPGSAAEVDPEDFSPAGEPALGGDTLGERAEIAAARRDLGRQLAAWRSRAKLTQQSLAQRTGYSRSTIASAEAGEPVSAAFWAAVDRAVNAGGRLMALHARIEAAVTAARRRAARQAWEARTEAAGPGIAGDLPEDSAFSVTDSACPRCGEPLTVTGAFRVTALIPQHPGAYPAAQRPD